MYYESIILGPLMVGPAHGYLIANIVQNVTVGPGEPVERRQEVLNDGHLEKGKA